MTDSIILTDEKGYGLTQKDLIARLTLYDVYCMQKSMAEGDYDYVASIAEQGKRGFNVMTSGELYCEWGDCEAGFWGMMERGEAPYELINDPIDYDPNKEYEQGRADHMADALAKDE